MTAQGERLRATLDAEIKNLSTLEHKLARPKLLLQEQATRLRLGASAEDDADVAPTERAP